MPPPSLHIPDRHAETDSAFLLQFLEMYPFAMLITSPAGDLRITNVPILLEPDGTTLAWHLAINNPQNEPLTAGVETTVVFHGPHSYISPNWYAAELAVPTWNFASVHCTGHPMRITDDTDLQTTLETLVKKNETAYSGPGNEWQLSRMPAEYLKNLRRGIVGYKMKIEHIEAKFKLGQERSAADRQGVLNALEAGKGREKSIAELTAEYYRRRS